MELSMTFLIANRVTMARTFRSILNKYQLNDSALDLLASGYRQADCCHCL